MHPRDDRASRKSLCAASATAAAARRERSLLRRCRAVVGAWFKRCVAATHDLDPQQSSLALSSTLRSTVKDLLHAASVSIALARLDLAQSCDGSAACQRASAVFNYSTHWSLQLLRTSTLLDIVRRIAIGEPSTHRWQLQPRTRAASHIHRQTTVRDATLSTRSRSLVRHNHALGPKMARRPRGLMRGHHQ